LDSSPLASARSCVAASIAHFVPFEVRAIHTLGRLGFLAALRHRALVAVLRMVAVIDVALELISAMKPRAGANEDFSVKPFRTVVAGGGAVIRSDVIITIGAFRGYPDVEADLSLCLWGGSHETDSSNCR
jgi:hypothetical protein